MYLDPYELNSFNVLARELHFHRAAEYLALSQPALSKQIRRLEEKIGGKLFTRTRRTVTLTEVGRVLWPLADALLKQSEAALVMATEASNGTAGTLHIGYGLATVHEILPKTVSLFSRKYPRIRLQMSDMSTASQLIALLNGTLDVGIVRLPVVSAELDSLALMRERLVLALPKSNRYRARKLLSDLRDAPFVLLSRSASPTFYDHAVDVCFRAGFTPNIVQEAKDTFTILNFVRAGLGVSLVQSAAVRMKVSGVRFCELRSPESEWAIGLAWRRISDKRDLIQRFIDTTRTAIRHRSSKLQQRPRTERILVSKA
jgi:DNA-binding transcriptional LysR family regulator